MLHYNNTVSYITGIKLLNFLGWTFFRFVAVAVARHPASNTDLSRIRPLSWAEWPRLRPRGPAPAAQHLYTHRTVNKKFNMNI